MVHNGFFLINNIGLDTSVKETSTSSCSSSSSLPRQIILFEPQKRKERKEGKGREKGGKEVGKEGKRKREKERILNVYNNITKRG